MTGPHSRAGPRLRPDCPRPDRPRPDCPRPDCPRPDCPSHDTEDVGSEPIELSLPDPRDRDEPGGVGRLPVGHRQERRVRQDAERRLAELAGTFGPPPLQAHEQVLRLPPVRRRRAAGASAQPRSHRSGQPPAASQRTITVRAPAPEPAASAGSRDPSRTARRRRRPPLIPARGGEETRLPEPPSAGHPRPRPRQGEVPAGARYPHVEEAPLLLDLRRAGRVRDGDHAVGEPHQEDRVPLEALRRVQATPK